MMTKPIHNNTDDVHRADIVAMLKKRKMSLRSLSVANGLSPNTLKNALDKPWPKGERIIAQALELNPQDIWPSRY